MRMAATCDGAMIVASRERRIARLDVGRALLVAVVLVGGRIRREVHARHERLVAGPVVDVRGGHARRAERPAVEARRGTR